jgi:hypothetical protein
VVVLPFFIMGRAMVGLAQIGAAWLAEGIRRKKGPSPSAPLKWTVGHPPHDHVIIVFDQGHARLPASASKIEP